MDLLILLRLLELHLSRLLILHLVLMLVWLHELCLGVVRSIEQGLLSVMVSARRVISFLYSVMSVLHSLAGTTAYAAAYQQADATKDRETNGECNTGNLALLLRPAPHVNCTTARALACIGDPAPALRVDCLTLLFTGWAHGPRHSKVSQGALISVVVSTVAVAFLSVVIPVVV